MQIGSNTLYDIGSNYSIKLNDKEILVVEEDPASRSRFESKKAEKEKEQETQKVAESKKSSSTQELSEDEERLVKDLSSRDTEVRAHEAAHQAAGGGLAGGASYSYQQGPDGRMYAIGGEVSISMPSGSSPEETVKNARQVAAAALAAGSPSPQDFSVASSAKVMEMKALQEITKQAQEELEGNTKYKEAAQNSLESTDQEEQPTLDISA